MDKVNWESIPSTPTLFPQAFGRYWRYSIEDKGEGFMYVTYEPEYQGLMAKVFWYSPVGRHFRHQRLRKKCRRVIMNYMAWRPKNGKESLEAFADRVQSEFEREVLQTKTGELRPCGVPLSSLREVPAERISLTND
jgi:hypothetical protein